MPSLINSLLQQQNTIKEKQALEAKPFIGKVLDSNGQQALDAKQVLLYYCCSTTVLLFYRCITTVLQLYCYCTIVIMLYYCTTTVLLYYCTCAVLVLYLYCTSVILYCTTVL